jgi:glycosyltransferase involved in cell wall biosynthesis
MKASTAYRPVSAKVSVALCTCNGSAYLAEQLLSLQKQTLAPAELVICDDLSTDDTARVVAAFAHDAPFPVSFNINPQRLGVTANFQHAFALCRYPLIAPCDQDDLWQPDKLARLVACFEEDPACLAAFCDASIITPEGRPTGQTQWGLLGFGPAQVQAFNQHDAFARLLRYNVVTGMAMMFRASLLKIALPLPHEFIHDEWLALVAAAVGRIVAVPEPLVKYRRHPAQKIGAAGANPLAQWRYARKNMDNNYLANQLIRTRTLLTRLTQPGVTVQNPGDLDAVREKIEYMSQRITMRQHLLSRWPGAMKMLATGQYTRFGHGWRSFAQDMAL